MHEDRLAVWSQSSACTCRWYEDRQGGEIGNLLRCTSSGSGSPCKQHRQAALSIPVPRTVAGVGSLALSRENERHHPALQLPNALGAWRKFYSFSSYRAVAFHCCWSVLLSAEHGLTITKANRMLAVKKGAPKKEKKCTSPCYC